jgi:DNA-binding MarR family transcriptional regulator
MSNRNQTNDLTITIPAAIASLPGLNLLEKAALARISELPGCSNSNLSKLTGLSVRGVEAMLTRFRERGLVEMVGKGRARRHELMFQVEHRTKCGKDEVEESRNKCGNAQCDESLENGGKHADGASPTSGDIGPSAPSGGDTEESTEDFAGRLSAHYESSLKTGKLDDALKHLEQIRSRVEKDTQMSIKKKTEFLTWVANEENLFFGLQTFSSAMRIKKLCGDQLQAAVDNLFNADPAKLSLFREQVEGGASPESALKMLATTAG